jgi:hypothetical protein
MVLIVVHSSITIHSLLIMLFSTFLSILWVSDDYVMSILLHAKPSECRRHCLSFHSHTWCGRLEGTSFWMHSFTFTEHNKSPSTFHSSYHGSVSVYDLWSYFVFYSFQKDIHIQCVCVRACAHTYIHTYTYIHILQT